MIPELGHFALILALLFSMGPLVMIYIEYKMDFSIVTPNLLIRYDQMWFFKRSIMTINALNIKTISVVKEWVFYSIFNNGDIVFLSEWDMEHGEIILHYIQKPEKIRHMIAKVLKRL